MVKGQRGARHRLWRVGNQAMMKAGVYQYRDRRDRKRDFRRLWITRINAACRANGMSYSRLTQALKNADYALNRKTLADLAVKGPDAFAQLIGTLKTS